MELTTKNIIDTGPTLDECLASLAEARALRLKDEQTWSCFFGFHQWSPGPMFETTTGDTAELWDLMICRKCFHHKKVTVAENESKQNSGGQDG